MTFKSQSSSEQQQHIIWPSSEAAEQSMICLITEFCCDLYKIDKIKKYKTPPLALILK